MSDKDINDYRPGEHVIYPAHGVGEIVGLEKIDIGDGKVEMMVIKFDHDRMTLRLPVDQLEESGLRSVASKSNMDSALKALKGKSRSKNTMWARRAQEYEGKINSGDPIAVAEVLRDLFRRDDQPEQSYSERQLYQSALDRLANELAIVESTGLDVASRRVEELLGKSFGAENASSAAPDDEVEAKIEAKAETVAKKPEAPKAAKASKASKASTKKRS